VSELEAVLPEWCHTRHVGYLPCTCCFWDFCIEKICGDRSNTADAAL